MKVVRLFLSKGLPLGHSPGRGKKRKARTWETGVGLRVVQDLRQRWPRPKQGYGNLMLKMGGAANAFVRRKEMPEGLVFSSNSQGWLGYGMAHEPTSSVFAEARRGTVLLRAAFGTAGHGNCGRERVQIGPKRNARPESSTPRARPPKKKKATKKKALEVSDPYDRAGVSS